MGCDIFSGCPHQLWFGRSFVSSWGYRAFLDVDEREVVLDLLDGPEESIELLLSGLGEVADRNMDLLIGRMDFSALRACAGYGAVVFVSDVDGVVATGDDRGADPIEESSLDDHSALRAVYVDRLVGADDVPAEEYFGHVRGKCDVEYKYRTLFLIARGRRGSNQVDH